MEKLLYWFYDIENGFLVQVASEEVAAHMAEYNEDRIVFIANLYPNEPYPHRDGDATVLGPDVSIQDGIVTWHGANFYPTQEYPHQEGDFTTLGPECFTNYERTVISYKGENFYRACDVKVRDLPEGGASHCVMRVNHPSNLHEDMEGNTCYA